MISRSAVWLGCLLLLFSQCKKTTSTSTSLLFQISYRVDSVPLALHSMAYTCDAGYEYEVTKLNYYLSHFVFSAADGSTVERNEVFYIDADREETNKLLFDDLPAADYSRVSFLIGLDSAHNHTDALPASLENINMIWPDEMGGGYHFMKLEGHYQDQTSVYGFAMHLGKNPNGVPIVLNRSIDGLSGEVRTVPITMNVNEWFRHPHVYDFNTDGNYSMSNDSAMHKLAANGVDVFE